jgi:hypothetical protein
MCSLWEIVHPRLIPRQLQVRLKKHRLQILQRSFLVFFAAAAAQCQVVYKNLSEIIENRRPILNYGKNNLFPKQKEILTYNCF